MTVSWGDFLERTTGSPHVHKAPQPFQIEELELKSTLFFGVGWFDAIKLFARTWNLVEGVYDETEPLEHIVIKMDDAMFEKYAPWFDYGWDYWEDVHDEFLEKCCVDTDK